MNLSVSIYYLASQEKLKVVGECLLLRQVHALKEFTKIDKMVREKLNASLGGNHENHRYSEDLQSQ